MSFWGANITNHSPYLKSQNQRWFLYTHIPLFSSLRAPKMLSMAVQPGISGGVFTQTSFPSKTLTFKPFKSFIKPKLSSFHSYKSLDSKQTPNNTRRREVILSAYATSVEQEEEEDEEEEGIDDGLLTVIDEKGVEVKENKVEAATPPAAYEIDEDSEMMGVFVNPFEKPRLVLKFVWMEKNIGLSLDQVIPEYGTIPLSPYYFWPRKDAWEELKTVLESKPWISQKKMIILLNQATDIINLWQQSGGNLS